jgi:hypothetical protein
MQPSGIITDEFMRACRDYFYLLERSYPERGVLKLVGDRYKLSRDQRTVLYRGISSSGRAEARRVRLVMPEEGAHLIIDGYNVLFTVLNYRLGRMVFISTDGILRDAGSLHSRLRDDALFNQCIDELLMQVKSLKPAQVDIFLDAPVSASPKHHRLIAESMDECGLKGTCVLVHSADREIKAFNSGILATSDTVLIEKTSMPVIDLPKLVLENKYGAVVNDIKKFVLS